MRESKRERERERDCSPLSVFQHLAASLYRLFEEFGSKNTGMNVENDEGVKCFLLHKYELTRITYMYEMTV